MGDPYMYVWRPDGNDDAGTGAYPNSAPTTAYGDAAGNAAC